MRFKPMGSDEGGLDEFVDFRLSLASSSTIRFWRESTTTKMAAWDSVGTVFQSGSGMGG